MSNRLKLLREKATRPRRTVPVLLDGAVRGQIEAVECILDRLDRVEIVDRRLSTPSVEAEREKLLAELDDLREQALTMTLFLVVEGLPMTAYEALAKKHKPRMGDDGRPIPTDRIGVNFEEFARPIIRACVVGYQETPDADAPVLPLDAELRETLDFLLGTDDEAGFATSKQVEHLATIAINVNRGDDAVPLPRPRSTKRKSAAG